MQTKNPETFNWPYLFEDRSPQPEVQAHDDSHVRRTLLLASAAALVTAVAIDKLWHRAFGVEDGGQA